jgi:hypothetical protein
LALAVSLVYAPTTAVLSGQSVYATFVGTVTNSDGRGIVGATVLLTNTANRLRRETTTKDDGTYSVVNMQPGTYELRISLGSSSMFERRGITVSAGDIARVDAQLKTSVASVLGGSVSAPAVETRQVQVALYSHFADGRLDAVAAIGGAETLDAYITADAGLCSLMSGREPAGGNPPGVGWRVTARVLSRSSEALTVRIDWQRLWENGARQSSPRSGTLEAAIRTGERFPLDTVTAAAGANCAVSGGSLEATVIARPPRTGGGGGALSTIRGNTSEPGRASAAAEELRLRAARQWENLARLAPDAFQVELWLVQTRPDQSEQVQLITQPFGGSTSFVFPPVRLQSESGRLDVEVFGFLRRTEGDGAAALNLQIAIGRNLRQQGAVERYSASGQTVPWPAPTEVLSFELPVSAAEQRLLAGHRFDLRLRLRPR